jgi:hypothetical protein
MGGDQPLDRALVDSWILACFEWARVHLLTS